MTKQEQIGKIQIEEALKEIDLDPKKMLKDKTFYSQDFDDGSELLNHVRNEPWGFVR